MQLNLSFGYTVTLTAAEFNLVNRALRGELRDDEERPARELARVMAEQKVASAKQLAHEITKLEDNLNTGAKK